MHSRIFELSEQPIPEDDRYSEDKLPDWFYSTVGDYACDLLDTHRENAIQWFVGFFGGQCKNDGDRIEFTDKALDFHFRRSYGDFVKNASLLTAYSFEAFCGKSGYSVLMDTLRDLNSDYEDKFGFYVYDRDCDELFTLDMWLRETDLSKPFFIGGTLDYHW